MREEGSEVPTPHSIPDVGLSRADDPRRRTHLSADPAHELNNDRPEPLAILYFSQRPIPRKRRRQFCHKAGVQYLEDEAPPLTVEASSFARLFMSHGDWRRTSKPSRPQRDWCDSPSARGRVRSHHCPSITSHAVHLQQWFSVIVVVAVAADWSWQNQTLERLGEIIFVAEALGRCICLATCT